MTNKRSIRLATLPAPELGEHMHIEIEVTYSEGGPNYFHGGYTRRGFYVSSQPVEMKGDGFRSYRLGGGPQGGRMLIEEAARFNVKKLDIFAKMVEPRIHAAMLYLKTGSVRDGLHYLKTGAFPEVAPVEQAPAVAQS